MARASKYEIAKLIEALPGNTPWGSYSMMTIHYDHYTRQELVDIYNRLVVERKTGLPCIS